MERVSRSFLVVVGVCVLLCMVGEGCKVICEDCIDCCDKFHGEAYLSGEGHTLSLRRRRRAAGLGDTAPARGLPDGVVRIPGGTLLAVCDGDGDGSLSWGEYSACTLGMAGTRAMERKFTTLDTNRDRQLSRKEMEPVALKMTGASSCHESLVTSCASQFVAYQRARPVSADNFCQGYKFYTACITHGATYCTDSRTDRLVATLATSNDVITDICSSNSLMDNQDSKNEQFLYPAAACATSVLRDLHSSTAPCLALRNLRQCLLPTAASGTNMPFREVLEDNTCL